MYRDLFSTVKASVTVVALSAALALVGCANDSPFQPAGNGDLPSLNKKEKGNNNTVVQDYPMSGSVTINYHNAQGKYRGGDVDLPNGSTLWISGGALTPPPGHPIGEPVTITISCDRDTVTNELIFTFGPHGSQFDPPAVVEFNYQDLGVEIAELFYIDEDGNYIPQAPDHVNVQNKTMELRFDHFSRYAIAQSQ